MFIQEVGLKNYQAHSNTVVDFIDGDNAIIGASDSGKTALKRAIECVLYNDHSGVDYIKEGEESFSVYVLLSDGTKITRERGKKRLNRYIIEKDGEKLVLENFGKNVPEEVTSVHKMFKVKIGKKMDSLFSARQLDGPFFLQNTPEERGAIISSIAKTEVIDEAVNMTLSNLREQRKEKKVLEKSLKEDNKKLEDFSYLDECEMLLESIKRSFTDLKIIVNNFNVNKSNLSNLAQAKIKKSKQESILEIFDDINNTIVEFEIISTKSKEINKIKKDFYKLIVALDEKTSLENIIVDLSDINEMINKSNNLEEILFKCNNYQKLFNSTKLLKNKLTSLENKINTLEDIDSVINLIEDNIIPKIVKYNNLCNIYKELNELCIREENGIKFISNKNKQINQKIEEYENGLLSLGKCPTCFNDISVEKVKAGLMS